jgi:peptide/nickel transport system permease protein
MPLVRILTVRALTLTGVLLTSLLLVVVTLGATGYSDRMMNAIINEELRSMRQVLAQTIRDPTSLESALEARRNELVKLYDLDKPWYFRLPRMVIRVLTLDLGEARTLRSFAGSSKVADIVLERVLNTVLLVTTALGVTAMIGLLIGVKSATLVGTKYDRVVSYLSATSYALPAWWTGIFFILIFAFNLHIFPSGGLYSAPPPLDPLGRFIDLVWHAILPILTLVTVSVGGWIYVVRTMVLNTSQEDFVNVARAKGLPESLVMRRYILRVAAPPILTSLILGLAGSIGGAILTETVFNWPGMGRLYYDAIFALDEPVIVALTFLFTLIYVVARFILEVLYAAVDPRVRY